MKVTLTRAAAYDLHAALNMMDGINAGGTFTPYQFTPEVIDRLVDNTLALKPLVLAIEEKREGLSKLLSGGRVIDGNHPKAANFNEMMMDYLKGETEFELAAVTRSELNLAVNRIPVSLRVRLAPIVVADSAKA